MLKILARFALLFILVIYLSGTLAAQGRPPVRNYQEYLLMMRAVNDVNKERGIKPVKPLSQKEWKKLWPNGGPDAQPRQIPK